MTCGRSNTAAGWPMVVLGAAAMVGGCSGTFFQSKIAAPSTYLLSANLRIDPASDRTAASLSADVTVRRPKVRAGLATDRIAVLYPDRRLEYFADARWSGSLDDVVQDLTLQAIDSGSSLRGVSEEASPLAGGYWLEMEVADFQAEYAVAGATLGQHAPLIHVRLSARLGAGGRLLGTFQADAVRPAADNRLGAIVAAFELATDAALADVIATTSRLLATESEHR